MQTTITVRLSEKEAKALEALCEETGKSRSEVVRDALRERIALARFEEARRRLIPYAEVAGYLTDEDVFQDVS